MKVTRKMADDQQYPQEDDRRCPETGGDLAFQNQLADAVYALLLQFAQLCGTQVLHLGFEVRAFDADRQTLYRNLWYQQCPGAIVLALGFGQGLRRTRYLARDFGAFDGLIQRVNQPSGDQVAVSLFLGLRALGVGSPHDERNQAHHKSQADEESTYR
jgi:hypothetical protein